MQAVIFVNQNDVLHCKSGATTGCICDVVAANELWKSKQIKRGKSYLARCELTEAKIQHNNVANTYLCDVRVAALSMNI